MNKNNHYILNAQGNIEKISCPAWLRHDDIRKAMPHHSALLSVETCCNIVNLYYFDATTQTQSAYVRKEYRPSDIKNYCDFVCLADRIKYTFESNKINNYPQEIELVTQAINA